MKLTSEYGGVCAIVRSLEFILIDIRGRSGLKLWGRVSHRLDTAEVLSQRIWNE